MIKSILYVLAGTVTWTVLWLSSNSLLMALLPSAFREDGSTGRPDILLLILVLSVIFSVVAGFVTARFARGREMGHVLSLGVLQLAIGIFVQLQLWDVLPIWYHLSFLALLIPGNLLGGWLSAPEEPEDCLGTSPLQLAYSRVKSGPVALKRAKG